MKLRSDPQGIHAVSPKITTHFPDHQRSEGNAEINQRSNVNWLKPHIPPTAPMKRPWSRATRGRRCSRVAVPLRAPHHRTYGSSKIRRRKKRAGSNIDEL